MGEGQARLHQGVDPTAPTLDRGSGNLFGVAFNALSSGKGILFRLSPPAP